MLAFTIFVFAPLQALGISVFHVFAIAALLAIIGGMLVISDHPVALAVMSVAFAANVIVFITRLLHPWPYNLHLLAGAWLAISVTLGLVVAQAVFRPARSTITGSSAPSCCIFSSRLVRNALCVRRLLVVSRAVFRPAKVFYHLIVDAILLYLLIAIAFGQLYVFVGLFASGSLQGNRILVQVRPHQYP